MTSPVFYALKQQPYLEILIEREFSEPEDLDRAFELIKNSDGIEQARSLAKDLARKAAQSLGCLAPSASKNALSELTDYAVSRIY